MCECQIKTGQTLPWTVVPALDQGLKPGSSTFMGVPHSHTTVGLAGHVLHALPLGMGEKGSSPWFMYLILSEISVKTLQLPQG